MPYLLYNSSEGRQRIELLKSNSIGRHSSNKIRIPDISISKNHASITINRYHRCVLSDLSSTNGTFVNNKKIKTATIYNGDSIKLGNVYFYFIGDRQHAAQMVRISNNGEGLFSTTILPKDDNRFLPEQEISDEATLRVDYEKLRVTYELQRDISLEHDIAKTLDQILQRTYEFLKYDQGVILLRNKNGKITPHSYKAREGKNNLTISSTLVKHVIKQKTGIISTNIEIDSRFNEAESIFAEGIKSTIAVPIINNNKILGVMILYSIASINAFTEKDLSLITTIANQTASIINNTLLHEEVQLSFESSIRTLSAVVDAKHPLTAGHSERVTELSTIIAKEMKLPKRTIEALKFGALMHDIGKIGIKDNILLKDGSFTADEKKIMDTHPVKTKEILDNFYFPKTLKDVPIIASSHHEMINGKGYPNGLKGEEIHIASRIIAVADVFDALTDKREYPKYGANGNESHDPLPVDDVVEFIKNQSGIHFDKAVVEAFTKCLPKILSKFTFHRSSENQTTDH
ncbi:MAG: HD domain-containing protein [Desulfobacteraceae bacterium]|nr:HD domain-containing protein [Desulfobacteraceae bacterium]